MVGSDTRLVRLMAATVIRLPRFTVTAGMVAVLLIVEGAALPPYCRVIAGRATVLLMAVIETFPPYLMAGAGRALVGDSVVAATVVPAPRVIV